MLRPKRFRLRLSGPRMRLEVARPEPLNGDVCVELRCSETRVPQKLLNGPKVRAAIEQMGRRRVAQGVGTARRGISESLEGSVDRLPCLPLAQAAAAATEEESGTAAPCHERRTRPEPADDGVGGRDAERHRPLLVALAKHANSPGVLVHVIDVETDELGDTDPRGIEELGERPVANGRWIPLRCRVGKAIKQPPGLILVEDVRKARVTLGRSQP